MKIVIATKNKGKLQEIKAILSDEKYEIEIGRASCRERV